MLVFFDDLPTYRNHVLVDGAFDPLHAGHVAYLQCARWAKQAPILCAVASDDDIRAKGREPLLPQSSRASVLDAICDAVYVKDRPTEQVIDQMRPRAYVKGMDWRDRLPVEQVEACRRVGAEVVFIDAGNGDSSTARLRAWALADADQSLDRLEADAHNQTTPEFDTSYFTGDWRGNAPFTYESRKAIEGRHPEIVKEVFDGLSVLDVGCGPGHFVRMLRELGMDAGGIDPSLDAVKLSNGFMDRIVRADVWEMPPKVADLAICREVLEHVPVREIPVMINQLFRVARRFVYITTRFHAGAMFDVATDFETDPTHISLLTQPFLRSLCVLNGGLRRRDLETKLDHMNKGRVLVYEV